jgi:hypothetical protein
MDSSKTIGLGLMQVTDARSKEGDPSQMWSRSTKSVLVVFNDLNLAPTAAPETLPRQISRAESCSLVVRSSNGLVQP